MASSAAARHNRGSMVTCGTRTNGHSSLTRHDRGEVARPELIFSGSQLTAPLINVMCTLDVMLSHTQQPALAQ